MPYDEEEERATIAAAQVGDLAAFDRLVRRYRPGAFRVARHLLGTPEAAEDAVQEAFLAAYKALPKLKSAVSFPAWLGAILRHRCRRIGAGERETPLALDRLILAHTPSIGADLERRCRQAAARLAVAALSEELRPSAELYYLEDWPVRRIAEFLCLPETTIKWRLHAARTCLRRTLEGPLCATDP